MRTYEEIWVALRDGVLNSNKSCITIEVSCKPHLTERIKKAVIKEKDMDTKYKHCFARMDISFTSKGLKFTLCRTLANALKD